MSENHDDIDPFISALRNDMPDSVAQARVQRRLVALGAFAGSAGLSVGAKAVGLGEEAASLAAEQGAWLSAAPKVGVGGKLVALGLSAKAGLSVLALGGLASLATLPVVPQIWDHATEARQRATPPASEERKSTTLKQAPTAITRTKGAEPSAALRSRISSSPLTSSPRQAKLIEQSSQLADQERDRTEQQRAPGELKHETQLMEQAIAASQRGDLTEAQHYLELHAQRYPNGLLATERQRLSQKLNQPR